MTNLSRRAFALAGLGTTATLGLGASVTPALAASHAATPAPAMFDAALGKY